MLVCVYVVYVVGDNAGVSPSEVASYMRHTEIHALLAAAAAAAHQGDCAHGRPGQSQERLGDHDFGHDRANDSGADGLLAAAVLTPESRAEVQVTVLIPPENDHAGAGAMFIDNAFDESFLWYVPPCGIVRASATLLSFYKDVYD